MDCPFEKLSQSHSGFVSLDAKMLALLLQKTLFCLSLLCGSKGSVSQWGMLRASLLETAEVSLPSLTSGQ